MITTNIIIEQLKQQIDEQLDTYNHAQKNQNAEAMDLALHELKTIHASLTALGYYPAPFETEIKEAVQV